MNKALAGKGSPNLYRRLRRDPANGVKGTPGESSSRSDVSYGDDLNKFYGIEDNRTSFEHNKAKFFGVGSTPKYSPNKGHMFGGKSGLNQSETAIVGYAGSPDRKGSFSQTLDRKRVSERKRSLGSSMIQEGSNGFNGAGGLGEPRSKMGGVGLQIMRPNYDIHDNRDSPLKDAKVKKIMSDSSPKKESSANLDHFNSTNRQYGQFVGGHGRRRADYHLQRKYVENFKESDLQAPTTFEAPNKLKMEKLEKTLERMGGVGPSADLVGS
eukprot:CAMPEP_0115006368 /NCGR_PEP_ID=MMETSP0216-20121206/20462_1 /TAXON_ID=223996 /ORGANISM="Protocruzia adherens, Strain Boccale" /LENGTH=267 /DNA_ID=CAMNT_0002372945 /DNA_START=383 /DNA_END=1186 /DNA_ORIENTATION=+